MIVFSIEYADVTNRQVRRCELFEATDIDDAARFAVEHCPAEWFVARVEQADVYSEGPAVFTSPPLYDGLRRLRPKPEAPEYDDPTVIDPHPGDVLTDFRGKQWIFVRWDRHKVVVRDDTHERTFYAGVVGVADPRLAGLRPRDLAWLRSATEAEGLRLAKAVRAGEVSRADVEAAFEQYGDAEPAIALRYLDEWTGGRRAR